MYHKRIIPFLASAIFTFLIIGSCRHELPAYLINQIPTGTIADTCDSNKVYFEQEVLPILISNCAKSGCHDNITRKEGVILTSYSSVINTSGIRPGNARESKLYKLIVTTNSGDRMPPPPMSPFTQQQINLIYNWIQQGAQNLICQNMCDANVYTYSGAVRNIISNKCQGCHSGTSPDGGIDLSTYTSVKIQATNGKLWGSVNQLPGYSAMPKNGVRLSDCEISQIKKWMDAGSPNN